MKKNKKSSSSHASYRHHMDLPDVVNMDVLSYCSDDELENRISFMNSERERALNLNVDPRPWEEEICYAQRELRVRNVQRFMHDKYLRTNPDFYPSYSEGSDQNSLSN